jgi:FlaA1/EpsC-like NDP-sugar epimerase
VDIKIEEIGLRPGEKLYEELLTDNAMLSKTENEKIYVEACPPLPASQLDHILQCLSDTIEEGTREDMIQYLHRLVPSYRTPAEVNAEALQARAGMM